MPQAFTITMVSLQFAVAIISVIGNSLVCATVFKQQMLQRTYNLFVLSLAIADLLVSVTVLPLSSVSLLLGGWPLNAAWCSFFILSDIVFCTSSILSMCAIAVDRFRALAFPIAYSTGRSRCVAITLIVGSWLVAIAAAIGSVLPFYPDLQRQVEKGECAITTDPMYVVPSSIVCFFLPSVIMLALYGKIAMVIKTRIARRKESSRLSSSLMMTYCRPEDIEISDITQGQVNIHTEIVRTSEAARASYRKRMRALIEDQENEVTSPGENDYQETLRQQEELLPPAYRECANDEDNDFIPNGHDRNDSEGEIRIKSPTPRLTGTFITPRRRNPCKVMSRDTRAAKVLAVVMVTYCVCWTPFFTVNIINSVWNPLPPGWFLFFVWLGYFNSMLNPFLYVGLSIEFRSALLLTLKPLLKRKLC